MVRQDLIDQVSREYGPSDANAILEEIDKMDENSLLSSHLPDIYDDYEDGSETGQSPDVLEEKDKVMEDTNLPRFLQASEQGTLLSVSV